MALEPMVKPIAYCEIDRYAQAVLLSRMADGTLPKAPIWDDIRTLDVGKLGCTGDIDIIYGGFPCQDISIAGPQTGLAGERSGLFFEIIRLVNEIRPEFVFLENVANVTVRELERILLEFTALRYDCRWTIVSAGELGARHRRERWWLLAHTMRAGLPESRDRQTAASSHRGPARTPAFTMVQNKLWEATDAECARMDDGIRPITHRIKCLGNAVVPLQAREAFQRLSGLK
jgi:DNA (cytosine-5)-methyltransferase 1